MPWKDIPAQLFAFSLPFSPPSLVPLPPHPRLLSGYHGMNRFPLPHPSPMTVHLLLVQKQQRQVTMD